MHWLGSLAALLAAGPIYSAQPVESRATVGFQQTGASSAASRQAFFFDFFILRALGQGADVAGAQWNLWGNVRVASVPQQINSPVARLSAGALNVNQLAQSAEFVTGLEYRPKAWIWQQPGCVRTLGWVLHAGATGPLEAKDSLSIFEVPAPESPQYPEFRKRYPAAAGVKYAGFVTPDRNRFQRQWGAGLRLATFDTSSASNAPATYLLTLGQDEAVTGGSLRSAVGRIDVFYPLPVPLGSGAGAFRALFLFGTATLRLGQADPGPTFLLNPAPATVRGSDANVAILAVPGNRDTYRIGVGLDVLPLLGRFKIGIR
ncbi:MAG: hypothetical protein HY822_03040 [Acidobacteria bacterium]|nr:hypothetical protein [Acidobacteriota bacterium]